jgi:hypothetical protein
VAARLDRTWKEFAAGLDERTSVLALSVLFHHKAEQVSKSQYIVTGNFILEDVLHRRFRVIPWMGHALAAEDVT